MSKLGSSTKIAFGFGLGMMAAGLVKGLRPAFQGLGKPLLKTAVKSGMILAREGRVKLAEFRETLADVTAEAELELRDLAPQTPLQEMFTETPKHQPGVM